MDTITQRARAEQFRQMHHATPMLVLPNVWDAASARIIEQVGFPAIATTSSGIAAALGYSDGERMSRTLMLDAIARITRVVACPVSADFEAGYGATLPEKVESVKAVIAAGAVGVNIEDSLIGQRGALQEIDAQAELIAALRALGTALDMPIVINARVDVFLRGANQAERRAEQFEEQIDQAVARANAYLRAGADCVYPIGTLDRETIARLVAAIPGPINIMGALSSTGAGSGGQPPMLTELAQLGVARVSLASSLMRAALGHIRTIARALRTDADDAALAPDALTSAELKALFPDSA